MSKKVSVLFIFLLFFQTITSGFALPTQSIAKGNTANIISGITLTDEDGNVLDADNLEKGQEVHVLVDWSVATVNMKESSSESIQVPNELTIPQEQQGVLIDENPDAGTYHADEDGTITVQVHEALANATMKNGTFSIPTFVANQDSLAEDTSQTIEAPENTETAKTGNIEAENSTNATSEADHQKDANEKAQQVPLSTQGESVVGAKKIEENIITGVELHQIFEDGEDRLLEAGTEITVENPYENFKVRLRYDFELPNNHGYGAGSTFTIQIPDVFTVQANPEPQALQTPDGSVFGYFTISSDGKIDITFNEKITEKSAIYGYIEAESEFDAHYSGPAEGEKITFPIEGEETLEFPVKFIPGGAAIDKQGIPNKGYNTETITWTVDFNKNLETIDEAILDDVTEGHHTFKEGSLKVYKLSMNADGTIDESKTKEITDHGFGDSFPLNLNTIDSAYRVMYDTTIPTDDKGESYKNRAILDGENIDPVDADASVAVKRGKPLEKKAVDYDRKAQTIDWEVKYNYDEKSISQEKAKLTDVFGDNQELVRDSIEVTQIEIDPDTGEEDEGTKVNNYTLTENDTGFVLQFEESIKHAYKIKYETTSTIRVEKGMKITNKITDEFGNEEGDSQNIGQQIFRKSNDSRADYEKKSTSWTLRINSDEYTMDGVQVVDTLPKGFTPKDITITHDEEQWSESDYTEQFDENTQQLTIIFNKPITKEVVITYTTDIDFDQTAPESNGSFKNSATVTWDPEGDNGSGEKEGNATFDPDNYTKANGFKGASYNYETKEIDWKIGVNYNKSTLDQAVVEDVILGDQHFDMGSVKVYHMKLTGGKNGYEIGDELKIGKADNEDEYELEAITGPEGEPGFRVKLGDIDTPYVITYQTDLNNTLVEKTYENIATVKSESQETFDLEASISPNHGGEYTKKTAKQMKENPRVVNWRVNINYAQSKVSNVSVTDTPSMNQLLLKDTIKLYDTVVTSEKITKGNLLEAGKDYTLEIVENEDGTETFTIDFTADMIDRAYVLEYDTRIMYKDNGNIRNDVAFKGEETADIPTDNSITKKIDLSSIGGGIEGDVGSLEVTKVDAADGSTPLAGATFELYDTDDNFIRSYTTGADGKVLFKNLLYGDYILKETNAPTGYVVGIENEQDVTVDADVSKTTIENDKIIYEATLTKEDAANPAKKLNGAMFELQQKVDGKFETIQTGLTTKDQGVIHVHHLEPGEFQFIETKAPEGYLLNRDPIPFTIGEKEIKPVQVIAKNNAIETTTITGEKTWKDDNAINDRPSEIAVDLLSDKEVIATKMVTADDNWAYRFERLPKTDELGNLFEYTVKEQSVDGYESIVDGYDLTNVRVGKTEVTGTKFWKDDNAVNDRPTSITVELLQNGEVFKTEEVTAANNWSYSFRDLEEFDEEGKAYVYTVREQPVNGYTSTVTDHDITNLRVGTTAVAGEKVWKDDNTVNDRPASITVELLQNNNVIQTKEVTAADNWQYTFTDLAEFDEEGKAYVYTVQEQPVDGYVSTVTDYDITNVRVGKTEVTGTKTWKDDNPEDRPTAIKVNLLQNGVVMDTAEVTEADNWTYTFTDLDEYDEEGVAYNYTVKEQPVPGYQSEVNGFDITNTRDEQIDIEVTKSWLDDRAADRPAAITVYLYQNGEQVDTVEVTAADDWAYTFTDLEAYDDNGRAFEYTVKEEPVNGYETTIHGFDITNLRVGTTEVSGTKTWKDDDSEDRPASITVELLQNNNVIQTKEVTAADNWQYSFTDLEKYDEQGTLYTYTVQEKPLDGYKPIVDQYDITNVRVGTTAVEGEKVWQDDHSKDRPDAITVYLLASGAKVDKIEVTAEMDWKYAFNDLPVYDEEGKAIDYSVEEKEVPGYTTKIDEFTIINTRILEDPITDTNKQDIEKEGEPLPATATTIYNLLLIGAMLLLAGLTVWYVRRKSARTTK